MSANSWLFYHQHLERVSRSFSFCIAQLSSPIREQVALAYLLFRVADTIEDVVWETRAQQDAQFDRFRTLLAGHMVADFLDIFPASTPLGERRLLQDLDVLLKDYASLPVNKRQPLDHALSTMMDGMQACSKLPMPFSLATLDRYCFYVAGLVGELLTHFFTQDLVDFKSDDTLLKQAVHFGLFLQKINILKDQKQRPVTVSEGYFFTQDLVDFKSDDTLLKQAVHFGLFLQKINILKDQKQDATEGRIFIADWQIVRNSVNAHVHEAFAYIQKIPVKTGRKFRLFCAYSLFIGLGALKWIDKAHAENKDYKISRSETFAIIFKLKQIIDTPRALDALFQAYTKSL